MGRDLSVGDVARRAGIAVSALHFYERKGLVQSRRTQGNQRRYDRHVLRRLAVIRMAQELGVSLAEVAEALGPMAHDHALTGDEWAAISTRWRGKLDRRIEMLTRLRDELTGCIGCGCLSMQNCPIYNLDDHLARDGSGPRRLMRQSEGGGTTNATGFD